MSSDKEMTYELLDAMFFTVGSDRFRFADVLSKKASGIHYITVQSIM